MTVNEFIKASDFEVICEGDNLALDIKNSVYCCDLLSYAMVRAPEDGLWVTVMGNRNVVAVASLTETAAVIIADGSVPDEEALAAAKEHGITLLKSGLPVYETAKTAEKIAFGIIAE